MPAIINPALSDGRALTSWLSSCELNHFLMMKSGARNEADYRRKLQENPRMFDASLKTTVDYLPYFETNRCPDPSSVQAHAVSK